MSRIEVDQVVVGKHVKIHTAGAMMDIHGGPTGGVGFWLANKGSPTGTDCIGAFSQKGLPPYFLVYPKEDFWEPGSKKLPFAFSPNGLQIPSPDGSVVNISLNQICEWAKALQANQSKES